MLDLDFLNIPTGLSDEQINFIVIIFQCLYVVYDSNLDKTILTLQYILDNCVS